MKTLFYKIFLTALLALGIVAELSAAEKKEADMREKTDKFAWGLGSGSSIDMTGNSMTSIDIDGYLGYKNHFFKMLGVGAGVNMVMNNSSRSFPVYGIIRTSFTTRPSLLFMDLRGGVSFNDLYNYTKQTGLYLHAGVGIKLASGRTWSSHFLVAYKFISRKDFEYDEGLYHCPNLSMATIGIGISF